MNVHAPMPDLCSEGTGLITIDEACAKAASYARQISATEDVPIHFVGGRTLAEEIVARLAMPAFDHSAMDGYALALGGGMLPAGARVRVEARIAAGGAGSQISQGAAARIFTGAPLPAATDAVLMQEHGSRDGDHLVLNRMVRPGDNIRRRGEDIEEGEPLLAPGVRLDARHVALLAAQGRARVAVQRRPRVAVISTGNELRQPGTSLTEGTIYDSNRPMIMTLAAEAGLEVVDGGPVPDNARAIAEAVRALAMECDLVLSTGGTSVGEEDHSAAAMAHVGSAFETLKIALKPGKPAVVGRIAHATYLGLPGNPVSALVSWLLLGGAITAAMEGRPVGRRAGCPMPAASRFERRPGRMEFAPARIVAGGTGSALEIIGRGGSARLRPLVEADGLAEIHPLHAPVEPGERVIFHPFRDGFAV